MALPRLLILIRSKHTVLVPRYRFSFLNNYTGTRKTLVSLRSPNATSKTNTSGKKIKGTVLSP